MQSTKKGLVDTLGQLKEYSTATRVKLIAQASSTVGIYRN